LVVREDTIIECNIPSFGDKNDWISISATISVDCNTLKGHSSEVRRGAEETERIRKNSVRPTGDSTLVGGATACTTLDEHVSLESQGCLTVGESTILVEDSWPKDSVRAQSVGAPAIGVGDHVLGKEDVFKISDALSSGLSGKADCKEQNETMLQHAD